MLNRVRVQAGCPSPAPGTSAPIAFRADMDALPIPETIDLPYGSQNDGVSHKCGHDGHCAALCGLALALGRPRFFYGIKPPVPLADFQTCVVTQELRQVGGRLFFVHGQFRAAVECVTEGDGLF